MKLTAPPFSRAKCFAFTLTELIVAICIVATLAGFLAAGLSKASSRANLAVCANNLRQIFTAWQLYAGDNNGYWPYVSSPAGTNGYPYLLRPYIPNVGAYGKPLAGKKGAYACPEFVKLAPEIFNATSYGVNNNLYLDQGKKITDQIPRMSIKVPSRTIMLGDACWFTDRKIPFSDFTYTRRPGVWWAAPPPASPSHANGGANLLFCDGHVEYWPDTTPLGQSKYWDRGPDDLWMVNK